MPKKIFTIEIDADEVFSALKSKNNVTLRLTVVSDHAENETESKFNLSPEDIKAMEKEVGWPF